MIEHLTALDHRLFFFINKTLQNDFFDMIMPFVRNRYFWIPLYLFLAAFFIFNFKKQSGIVLLLLLAVFAITDYSSSSIIKPFFERFRPCRNPFTAPEVHLLIPCGSGYSFVSTHAANHFGIAVFLIAFFVKSYPWVFPAALLWAGSIAFAQVYVGVHFPFDVLCGGIWGSVIGFPLGKMALKYSIKKQA